ncbi:MAG: hypothetical protein M1816_002317 [Peltula sp. TS41687]|nr:MAG: hypothetical protein M1816_002317 [Peltula sp. TS41687]
MAPQTINILLTTFPGLDLPSTLLLQAQRSSPISDLLSEISSRIPTTNTRLILTTTSNRALTSSSPAPISTLLRDDNDDLIPLRLSVPLCGGKGGFGSQLRAAGGRMSSRRKRNQGENNGSNRNLDGRRLRTVTEAKALAEYLALKPEMEKREREARRKRWELVVEMAERREEEIRSGAKARVDGKWVEDKDEAAERTREAVLAVLKEGGVKEPLLVRSSASGIESGEDEEMGGSGESASTTPSAEVDAVPTRKFFGFDEEDEFMSDDDEEKEEEQERKEGEDGRC